MLLTLGGDRIAAVDSGVEPPAGATRLDGLTLPGFANAHSHAFQRALRGRTHRTSGTFWSWREAMYRLAARLDPDTFEELATATFAEMVLAGYTVVGEFHYVHHGPRGVPYADPNELGRRVGAAAERAGLRLTLLDTCYLRGGVGVELDAVQRRFADADAAAWAERADALRASSGPDMRVGAAVHSVRAVDPPSIAAVAGWADSHGAVLHAHVSEQPAENEACLAAYGCTPVELLGSGNALSQRFTAVHATHVTPADITNLGSAGCGACICPTTERDLADGIGPAAALAGAGVALCLGSDSHAVVDPFAEARAIELDARLASGVRGTHTPADLLAAATTGGYRSLGWNGGELAAGQLGDLVTIGLDSPRLAGCAAAGGDVLGAAIFAATAGDVRDVFVGGRRVVRGGSHVDIDVTAALASSIAAAWEIVR